MSELFNNLGIDVRLLLAQTVNFLLVLWLLNRFVFKKVLKFLDERKQGIEKGVELTMRAKREIERIGEARKVAMGKARELAESMVAQAKSTGAVAEKEIVARARATAETLLKKSKEEAERKKQDALKEAETEMQKRAFLLAEKVLSRSLTTEDQARMGQELLKEVQEHGKES